MGQTSIINCDICSKVAESKDEKFVHIGLQRLMFPEHVCLVCWKDDQKWPAIQKLMLDKLTN